MPTEPNNTWLALRGELCEEILSGKLSEGDALPSVRSLVTKKQAHHTTVRRAYDDLHASGLIVKRKGRPHVVAKHAAEIIRQERRREFLEVELPRIRQIMHDMELNWSDLERLSAETIS